MDMSRKPRLEVWIAGVFVPALAVADLVAGVVGD
jgi:hypothetical protein